MNRRDDSEFKHTWMLPYDISYVYCQSLINYCCRTERWISLSRCCVTVYNITLLKNLNIFRRSMLFIISLEWSSYWESHAVIKRLTHWPNKSEITLWTTWPLYTQLSNINDRNISCCNQLTIRHSVLLVFYFFTNVTYIFLSLTFVSHKS